MELKQFYNIATKVSSSATTFGDLPDWLGVGVMNCNRDHRLHICVWSKPSFKWLGRPIYEKDVFTATYLNICLWYFKYVNFSKVKRGCATDGQNIMLNFVHEILVYLSHRHFDTSTNL